ncbi:MAG: hypothetical protein HY747_10940 [Elusimicrobia bacterium]|nr:hypothetical protein [Elusimicrobiota bacterium]
MNPQPNGHFFESQGTASTYGNDPAIQEAISFGIDISLVESMLLKTPQERVRDLESMLAFLEQIRPPTGI